MTLSNGTVVTVPTRGPLGQYPITSSLSYGVLVSGWITNPLQSLQEAAKVAQLGSYSGSASFAVRYHNDYIRVLEDSVAFEVASLSNEINEINDELTIINNSLSNVTTGGGANFVGDVINSFSKYDNHFEQIDGSLTVMNESVSVHELNINVLAGSYNKTLQTVMHRMQLFEAFVRAAEPAIEMTVNGSITNFSGAFPAWPADYATATVDVLTNGGNFAFGDNWASYSAWRTYTMYRFAGDEYLNQLTALISDDATTFVLQNAVYTITRPDAVYPLYTDIPIGVGETANYVNSTTNAFDISFNDGSNIYPLSSMTGYSVTQLHGFASTKATTASVWSFFQERPLLTISTVMDNVPDNLFSSYLEMGQGNYVVDGVPPTSYTVQFMQTSTTPKTITSSDSVALVNTTSRNIQLVWDHEGTLQTHTVESQIDGQYEGIMFKYDNGGTVPITFTTQEEVFAKALVLVDNGTYGSSPVLSNQKITTSGTTYVYNGGSPLTGNTQTGIFTATSANIVSFLNTTSDPVYATYYDGLIKKNVPIPRHSNFIATQDNRDYNIVFSTGTFTTDTVFSMYTYNLANAGSVLTVNPSGGGNIFVSTGSGNTTSTPFLLPGNPAVSYSSVIDNLHPTISFFNTSTVPYTVTTMDVNGTIYGGKSIAPGAGLYMTYTQETSYSIAVPLPGHTGRVFIGLDSQTGAGDLVYVPPVSYTHEISINTLTGDVNIRDYNHFSTFSLGNIIEGTGLTTETFTGNFAFLVQSGGSYIVKFNEISSGRPETNTNLYLTAGELFISSVTSNAGTYGAGEWIFIPD